MWDERSFGEIVLVLLSLFLNFTERRTVVVFLSNALHSIVYYCTGRYCSTVLNYVLPVNNTYVFVEVWSKALTLRLTTDHTVLYYLNL